MYHYSASELTAFGIGSGVLLALNAVFVAAEFSLVKLRFTRFGSSQMKDVKQHGRVAALLEDISGSIKILRLGSSMFSIGSALLLTPLAYSFVTEMGWALGYELRIALLIAVLVGVILHFVLGELVPRALALQHPVPTIKVAVPIVTLFGFFVGPISKSLSFFSGIILSAIRLKPNKDLDLLDVESQIRSLLNEGDELPAFAESIVSNALQMRKRVAHDIMIPRNQLQYIDLEDGWRESLELARKAGHTRYPVCNGDLDHAVGIVHIKDVFRTRAEGVHVDWKKLKRPMLRFSMDESLENVLQSFLRNRKHFALLKDEFGGTVGAVTLEDVLEELVGEIQDEFDREEKMVTPQENGKYEVDGLVALHDLSEELGVEIEADEVSTFGGYVTYELGRMPKEGETLRIGDLEITITSVDERRILSATVVISKTEEEATEKLVQEGE